MSSEGICLFWRLPDLSCPLFTRPTHKKTIQNILLDGHGQPVLEPVRWPTDGIWLSDYSTVKLQARSCWQRLSSKPLSLKALVSMTGTLILVPEHNPVLGPLGHSPCHFACSTPSVWVCRGLKGRRINHLLLV